MRSFKRLMVVGVQGCVMLCFCNVRGQAGPYQITRDEITKTRQEAIYKAAQISLIALAWLNHQPPEWKNNYMTRQHQWLLEKLDAELRELLEKRGKHIAPKPCAFIDASTQEEFLEGLMAYVPSGNEGYRVNAYVVILRELLLTPLDEANPQEWWRLLRELRDLDEDLGETIYYIQWYLGLNSDDFKAYYIYLQDWGRQRKQQKAPVVTCVAAMDCE